MPGTTACPRRHKLAILFLGRKRPGFSPDWGKAMEVRVLETLGELPYDVFIPSAKAVDDSTVREALTECRCARADVLVVLQPTMSDGRLVPVLAQLWGDSLVLWATPENPEGEMISACSLVGAHAFAATLRQLGRPFEIVYGNHDWNEAKTQLARAVDVVTTASATRHAKLGLIGYHAPGFIDMHPDPFVISKTFGLQMQHVGLTEYMDLCHAQSDADVRADLEATARLALPLKDVEPADLALQSRMYLALKQLIRTESLEACAIRCWPELPNVMGQWPYLALARLVTDGFPIACEGDVDGAIACLLASKMQLGPVYLSDWLEHDEHHVTIWHGGMAPLQLCEELGPMAPRLARHFNSKKPIVVDATVAPGKPVTLFRLWNCDGRYHLAAMEGRTVPPTRHLLGTNGRVEIPGRNLYRFFEELCHLGMPHHLLVVEGHRADALRALARRLGLSFVS